MSRCWPRLVPPPNSTISDSPSLGQIDPVARTPSITHSPVPANHLMLDAPKAYASTSRARRLREELSAAATSVTDAIYGAGFNSNSRFYEVSDSLLGMRARDYRAGGHNTKICP